MADIAVLEGNILVLLGKRGFLRRQAAKTGRVLKRGVRSTGHAIAQASRVSKRVAKRAIRAVAKAVLLKGDGLLGSSVTTMSKTQAKAVLMAPATAAVANTVPVAVPLVPLLVNEVVDEVFAAIKKRVAKGLSPEAAAAQVKTALENDDDKVLQAGVSLPVILGVSALVVGVGLAIKKRRS